MFKRSAEITNNVQNNFFPADKFLNFFIFYTNIIAKLLKSYEVALFLEAISCIFFCIVYNIKKYNIKKKEEKIKL